MKKSVIFISISLGLIILLGIGVSYSMWNISVSQDTTNMAESKCFDLSISNQENNINLDNAYPISNDKGKELTPFTFTVTNTCDITAQYSVNLEVLKSSTLSSKFIDVMFEGNINLLSSYDNGDKLNSSSIESRKLATGVLKSNESKDYSLRLWIDYDTTMEDLNNEVKSFKSKIVVVGQPIKYDGDTVFNFDYIGDEQTFTVPVSGTYKLETWGAQGGNYDNTYIGGTGAYASSNLSLLSNTKLYITIGGSGTGGNSGFFKGGYNGGGNGYGNYCKNDYTYRYGSSGGGATHIALKSGLLSLLKDYKEQILMVSGGGGGVFNFSRAYGSGASAGGVIGNNSDWINNGHSYYIKPQGGTQTSGGVSGNSFNGFTEKSSDFGIGGSRNGSDCSDGSGGGSGYYGGGAGMFAPGAGGSSYIGNSLLTNKVMYCYDCEESFEESTKTISTTCNEETPTSYCAKKGNGYARITLVSIDE